MGLQYSKIKQLGKMEQIIIIQGCLNEILKVKSFSDKNSMIDFLTHNFKTFPQ